MSEIWRPVLEYEGYYEVSNLGRLRSVDRESTFYSKRHNDYVTRVFKGKLIEHIGTDRDGYRKVTLAKDGVNRKRPMFRLVAEAFVNNPDPENKISVNHIDGVKTNDRAENLEWVTRSENMLHAYRTGLAEANKKPILLINMNNEIVRRFSTKQEAIKGNWRKEFPKPYGAQYVYKCFEEKLPFHNHYLVYEKDFLGGNK
jgi:hypothetical protein